ncbi:MATE family efflux transporter [Agathobacter sp.]
MDQTFMKEKKILPLVMSMSLPMVLSMLVNSLFNIVDSFFVAKMSEDAMTALSLVYPVQIVQTAVAVGFGIGINVLIAYMLGAQQQERADYAATTGVVLSVLHGVLIIVVTRLGMPAFLGLFTRNEEVIDLGLRYSNIAFLFAPIVTIGVAYEKIFQSVGRMKETMISMMVGFVANIILDPLMIFGIGFFPKMGMEGAALATGIGQAISLVSYLTYYFLRPLPVKIDRHHIVWQKDLVGRMYSVGIPSMFNLALSSVLLAIVNAILSIYGDACVLVFGAYYKLQSFIYLPGGGVIQGIRPIIGYNHGAGEKKRVRSIFITAIVMTTSIMVVGTVLCLAVPGWLMGLFTENAATIAIGETALRVICLGFIVSAVSVTCCGALEGLGKGMPSLVISLMRYIILIIPLAFVLSRAMNAPMGVWIAFPVTELITAVVSIVIYKIEVNKA